MLIVRFYIVIDQLCTEMTFVPDVVLGEQVAGEFIGRNYRHLGLSDPISSLYSGMQQLFSDHCAEGYHDSPADWL